MQLRRGTHDSQSHARGRRGGAGGHRRRSRQRGCRGAFNAFYVANKYAFSGDEQALNFAFATSHDSSHLLAGYDTTPRGELLASTFPAAMHRKEAMSGHVLPVIFSWHLGIALNEVAGAAKGALDPQEFWHAWARGEQMKVDLFDPKWDFWAATGEPIDACGHESGSSRN